MVRVSSNDEENGANSSQQFTVDDQAVHWHFDLSQCKSLQTLETTAESMVAMGAAPNFLSTVLSTITSPLPLDLIIVYWETDVDRMIRNWSKPVVVKDSCAEIKAANVLHHQHRFRMFHEMYRVRGFQLVLCIDVVDCAVEQSLQVLEGLVEVEKAKGGFDYLFCEPLIISEIRSPRTRFLDTPVGWTGRPELPIIASAL